MTRSPQMHHPWACAAAALLVLLTTALPACRRRDEEREAAALRLRIQEAVDRELDRRTATARAPRPPEPLPKPPEPALAAPLSNPLLPHWIHTDALPPSYRVLRGNTDFGSADRASGPGTIEPSAVARIIRGQAGGIRACYERELRAQPTLSGRLDMAFTIGPSGRVVAIVPGGPLAAAAPAVASCVASRIRGLVFPTPDGGDAAFTLPITLTPAS